MRRPSTRASAPSAVTTTPSKRSSHASSEPRRSGRPNERERVPQRVVARPREDEGDETVRRRRMRARRRRSSEMARKPFRTKRRRRGSRSCRVCRCGVGAGRVRWRGKGGKEDGAKWGQRMSRGRRAPWQLERTLSSP